MSQFRLPDVGEGLTEADIVTWHVAVGDVVVVNQPLVDIETAKSVVELPSPFAGTVTALMVEVGQTVEVGTPIIDIAQEGEEATPAPTPAAADEATPQPAEPAAMEIDLSNPAASGGSEGESLVGRTKAERGRRARRRPGAPAPAAAPAAAVVEAAPAAPAEPERPARVRTKPLVRRLARDLGVDLTQVPPTGPEGTVTKDDVLAVATGTPGAGNAAAPAPDSGRSSDVAPPATTSDDVRGGGVSQGQGQEQAQSRPGTTIPVKGVVKAMSEAMSSSAFTAPHVTEWITVDVSATVRLVESLRARREFAGLKVTPTLLVAKACLLAMRRTPVINSTFATHADGSSEIVLHDHVNLGLAAATPRGLMVPNIKDADRLDLRSLATAITDLVGVAKEGRTQPAEMAGGTFTITNVGVFGVDAGTPIINPGESAILAVGAINRRPWVDEETDEIVARDVITLALSFDHRHVDGEAGSRFLADVAAVLRDPSNALLL